MKKNPKVTQLEKDIKEALRTGNKKLLVNSANSMYKYLNFEQKARVIAYTKAGEKPSENYGKQLIDSIMAKQTRKQNAGKKALAKSETIDEDRYIRSNMKITVSDIHHLSNNIEIVKRSTERAKEVAMKAMYREETYSQLMKAFYGKGNKVASAKFSEEIVNYMGGNKQEGYVYQTRKNAEGKIFEIRTPGYDERKGRFHGYQYRELGTTVWIGR